MTIDLRTLEIALERLLAYAKESRGATIEIPDDLYWFVQRKALTDPENLPGEVVLTLGSLHDDWLELQRVARGERDPMAYDLVWASCVLRRVGDEFL